MGKIDAVSFATASANMRTSYGWHGSRHVGTCSVVPAPAPRSEERRVGKECRSRCDWSSDVCSSDLRRCELRNGVSEHENLLWVAWLSPRRHLLRRSRAGT